MSTAKVLDLLLAVPKYGRVKANRVLERCRVSPVKTVNVLLHVSARNCSTCWAADPLVLWGRLSLLTCHLGPSGAARHLIKQAASMTRCLPCRCLLLLARVDPGRPKGGSLWMNEFERWIREGLAVGRVHRQSLWTPAKAVQEHLERGRM